MRRSLSIMLFVVFAVAVLAGSGIAGESPWGKLSGKPLRVGTMALTVGVPVHYADMKGYFKEAGLDVEVIVLATGAPINEAMGAGQLDIAASGMASVFGLATGRYKYIGDTLIVKEGDSVYARPDSIYAKTKGPRDGILGDAKTVKGAKILGPLSTSGHLSAIKYIESLGLTTDDFQMVSMDYAQATQAFIAGQGDMVGVTTPWSNQLKDAGYVRVSDLGKDQHIYLVDALFVQEDLVKERRADLLAFVDAYYRASAELIADKANWAKVAREWYAEEGKNYSEQMIGYETTQKTYSTLDTMLTPDQKFGQFMLTIGEFFMKQGMITPENYPNIQKSLDPSFVEEVKGKRGKK